jgi:hypothetical protein
MLKRDMETIAKEFISLDITPSLIQQIEFSPQCRFYINLLISPDAEKARSSEKQKEYFLFFNNVQRICISTIFSSSLRVEACETHLDSSFLRRILSSSESPSTVIDIDNLIHFKIVCAQGIIDIAAESFNCSLSS